MKLYWRLKRNGRWTWEAADIDTVSEFDTYRLYRIRKHEEGADECR